MVKRTLATLSDIITEFLPIIKKIANQLSDFRRIVVQKDDLIQVGLIGLIKAYQDFNPKKGAQFKTYATLRIRGHMIDELRSNDWHGRSYFHKHREQNATENYLSQTLGHQAMPHEIKEEMQISEHEFQKLQLDNVANNFCEWDENLSSELEFNNQEPSNIHYKNTLNQYLKQFLNQLSHEEQQTISLHYHHDFSLKEIGEFLHLSESRVCQINHSALEHIRALAHQHLGKDAFFN